MPFMRFIGSWSLHQMVAEPSAPCSISNSMGMKVAGRWCCGQLNSTPPEIHGPARPYQRRLNDVLPIEEIVAIHLVEPDVNAAANFRKNHEAQILVFDVERFQER